jgi:two-component system OmpR family sensor kinase/two-component system sensor histidine kinase BaeS
VKRFWVQQTLAFSIVVIVTMSAIAIWINREADREFRKYVTFDMARARDSSDHITQVLQDLSAYYRRRGGWEGVESLLGKGVYLSEEGIGLVTKLSEREWLTLKEKIRLLDIMLVDVNGRIIFDTSERADGKVLTHGELANAWPITDVDDIDVIGYVLPFYITLPLDERQEQFLYRVEQVLLVNTALAVVLIVGVGALLSRRLNAPLQRLAAAARAVAAGDLAQQVETRGSVEIAQVGRAFNEMTRALQEAELLRQNMVADVAHELRTPLSVLQGNLWAVLNDTYPLEKAEIARLYDETRLLSRLVEDLHDLALADAGQLQLNVQPMDAGQLIRHTVDNFALVAEAQDVNLTLQLPDDLPPAQADPDRVAQVLRNLLVNALRHTPPGGAVTVEAVAQSGVLEIAVADTGEGIAPEHIAHVFKRFWRADPARSRSSDEKARLGSGTGLGLAVAQSLVEAQGGRIWVESTLGEGTTFRFTLPFEQRH